MKYVRRALAILLPLLMIGGLIWVYVERQQLYDWWALRNYTPSKAVVELAGHTTMTPVARHDFYVNHPELITSKTQFQTDCTQTEQTIVLGCYHGGQGGIFIYNVDDPRLDGVAEVTAAHEMLHAAYDRLGASERAKVDGWLQDFYNHDLHDKRIIQTIKSYQKTEPKDVVNEMHSVFGSEVRFLPKNLESYYKRYFSNRIKIIDYSEHYEAAFRLREDKIKALSDQLHSLADRINKLNDQLKSQKHSLDAGRHNLHSQAEADAFNARVNSFNSQIGTLNALIKQYNDLRAQYGRLVLQQQELFNAINTQTLKANSAR